MRTLPDFRSRAFLKEQIFRTLDFYYPRCVDHERGGFFNSFRDDGTIADNRIKHLVGTTRFIYVFSVGALLGGPGWCIEMAERGLRFLRDSHADTEHGGFYNELNGLEVADDSKQGYGHAHVMLAASVAYRAGLLSAGEWIDSTFDLLEKHAWLSEHELYADEFHNDWSHASCKRGQNANMHLCEAMIYAYEATKERKYLDRAVTLARRVVLHLAAQTDGLIWETFHDDWTPDRSRETRTRYGTYGILTGHLTEWSKLLVMLSRYQEEDWMLPKAEYLFRTAVNRGWDSKHGGLNYSLDIDGTVLNGNKSWWVAAESIGAAAVLLQKTGDSFYAQWYLRLWEHVWMHLIDHKYGAWYADLSPANARTTDLKSPFHKTDYHPISAMYAGYQVMPQDTE
ncbi:AGE family epimerase/isomerase [Xylanibacillus composti]|nr:AGE family epimerase/isomerase [Xylanibacillus composti]MDT9725713.1 AGE family epimerase/isomerase [Xylanibacillus composti]